MTNDQTDFKSSSNFPSDLENRRQESLSSINLTTKRQAFDPVLAAHRAKEQAAFDSEFKTLIARYSTKFENGGKLRISKEGRINIKGPEGQSRVYDELINRILSVQGSTQTQTTIRQTVQTMYPDNAVPKDWTKKLPAWKRRELKLRINGVSYGAAFTLVKVNSNTTLSSLHSAAKAALQRQQDGFISVETKITISEDMLTIGGISAKISATKSGGKTYRYARINAEELLTHLGGQT